jgi:hypothetical protein
MLVMRLLMALFRDLDIAALWMIVGSVMSTLARMWE